jgi:hypothetical protein
MDYELQITQHIRCGLTPLPFRTLLLLVATLYMLETLSPFMIKGVPCSSIGQKGKIPPVWFAHIGIEANNPAISSQNCLQQLRLSTKC